MYDNGEDFIDGGWIESKENLPQTPFKDNNMISEDSIVVGSSLIKNSSIYSSHIIDSIIVDSGVKNCRINDSNLVEVEAAVNSNIFDSVINKSTVKDSVVDLSSIVINSFIKGAHLTNSRVYDADMSLACYRDLMAYIKSCYITNNNDFFFIRNTGDDDKYIIAYRAYRNKVSAVNVHTTSFDGSVDGFLEHIEKKYSTDEKKLKYYRTIVDLIKQHLELCN